jgi:hypothetical protein
MISSRLNTHLNQHPKACCMTKKQRKELNEKLSGLFTGKSGTIKKVEIHTNSPVAIGLAEQGSFSLHEFNGELMLLCTGPVNFIKTSPIQSIELLEQKKKKTRVLFRTWTSTYEVVMENDKKSNK